MIVNRARHNVEGSIFFPAFAEASAYAKASADKSADGSTLRHAQARQASAFALSGYGATSTAGKPILPLLLLPAQEFSYFTEGASLLDLFTDSILFFQHVHAAVGIFCCH